MRGRGDEGGGEETSNMAREMRLARRLRKDRRESAGSSTERSMVALGGEGIRGVEEVWWDL
jgi:hypothetical protein